MAATFELTVQQQELIKLRAAMKAEADGKKLEAGIRVAFRVALQPLVPEVQSGVLEYHSAALHAARGGLSLAQAVAAGVKVGVNLSGRHTGARIYISKKGMPRGFTNAPRDLNKKNGWQHPSIHHRGKLGKALLGARMVRQIGPVGFFDKPITAKLGHYRVVCQAVMDQMAERIAARSR